MKKTRDPENKVNESDINSQGNFIHQLKKGVNIRPNTPAEY
jgi:hypothetical protein